MKDPDIQALALKHGLPVTHAYDHPWAYADAVMAFGRDLAGGLVADGTSMPAVPTSIFSHPKLGEMWQRLDLQLYAVKYAKQQDAALDAMTRMFHDAVQCLSAIDEALGIDPDDAGGAEPILEAIKDLKIHPEHAALDAWWVTSLNEFWGNGTQNDDTRRAAKVACNMAAQLHAGPDADRRDAFEAIYPIPNQCIRVGEGYAATAHGAWQAHTFIARWEGFKACALRADPPKSECAARRQGTAGGNAPAECDWPACDCDPKTAKVIDALHDSHQLAMTQAQSDVLRERSEQCTREGFTPYNDDALEPGELAMAAISYARTAGKDWIFSVVPITWPWNVSWWKPKDKRRNLVKAAALLIAEIEKLDRQPVIGAKS